MLAGCRSPDPLAGHVDTINQLKGNEPLVASILYEMGADITARDNEGLNVLHSLLLASNWESKRCNKIILDFIKDAPLLIHQKDRKGDTPLHYALRLQRIRSIEPLLSAGSTPLEPDSDGNTALHYLAQAAYFNSNTYNSERLQLFQKFLDLGVSINAKNKLGETPMFIYIANGPYNFHWAEAIREDITVFQDAGVDFLVRNNDMATLLHIAAKKAYKKTCPNAARFKEDRVDRFKFLMEQGCDPLAEDINQRTALDVAAACGNEDILKIFKRDEESKETVQKGVPWVGRRF